MIKERYELWPNHVFRFQYTDFDEDKSRILNYIKAKLDMQETDIDSGVGTLIKTKGLKESKLDLLDDNVEIMKKVKNFCVKSIREAVQDFLPNLNQQHNLPVSKVYPHITDSWYHVTNDGGYHGNHMHPGSSWGGIFYIQSSECSVETNNGVNRFFNTNSAQGPADLGSYWTLSNSIHTMQPTEGTLILFPAWLWHDSTPYSGEQDRVIISFNSIVRGE